ncbi:hypothetical protein NGC02_01525 [Mammaliicoccus sciuri]|uniref:hypothetical protein n=1 Tax=Mammaliicoccus sciuri TaxID=1296 RepID=UPI002DBA62E9|nr:hypothetical protein [Mammaliicoccus sciuri]MEB7400190.1 hypothetical protein [Mammaliicoccus sciuri]
MKEILIEIITFGFSGLSFMFGALISTVLLIPFEENLIQFLRNRYLLVRKKAVRGTKVRCTIYPKFNVGINNTLNLNDLILSGKFEFIVNLPYKNISEDCMPINDSDNLIKEAIYQKYNIRLDGLTLNNVSPSQNIIIKKEDLDLKVL